MTDEDKTELNEKIAELKTLHKEKNVDALDKATESLNETWTKISTKLYSQMNENSADATTETPTDDSSTEDIPFEEVK